MSNFDGVYMHRYVCNGLIFREYEVLLIKKWGKPWDLPGGKKEQNESLEDCVVRETHEETNARVKIIKIYPSNHYYSKERRLVNHRHHYLLEHVSGKIKNKEPKKHEAVSWFDMRALPANIRSVAKQFINEYYTEKLKIISVHT